MTERFVLGMRVHATSYEQATRQILDWVRAGGGRSVACATVHMVMECFDRPGFRKQINSADMVTSDGMPLVWALRWLGVRDAQRVYGPDLTQALLKHAEAEGITVGLLGSTDETLRLLQAKLRQRYPSLMVRFSFAPPFRKMSSEEDSVVLKSIQISGVQLLFVGLGCPKQEDWAIRHQPDLKCVTVAVGAAFDFLSGVKRQAPRWMQSSGLEWLFRLGNEPCRLWRRYLFANTRFIWHFGAQLREREVP